MSRRLRWISESKGSVRAAMNLGMGMGMAACEHVLSLDAGDHLFASGAVDRS